MFSAQSFRKTVVHTLALTGLWVVVTAYRIVAFAGTTAQASADVAIVLGAAVWDGEPSPVFRERIKHGLHLYESGQVQYLLFTGGVGDGDLQAEAEVARAYASQHGVPADRILLETRSRYTYENLTEACAVMNQNGLATALIVSDPLHMLRADRIAGALGLAAAPSPTPTTRYQTWRSKSGALAYEVFFLTLHYGQAFLGQLPPCRY